MCPFENEELVFPIVFLCVLSDSVFLFISVGKLGDWGMVQDLKSLE